MKTNLILSLIAVVILSVSCKKESDKPGDFKPVQLTEKQKLLVTQTNSFGFDFFRQMYLHNNGQSNLLVSPLSVSMAFGMARNGASGNTLSQMNQALGFSSMSEEEINNAYKNLIGSLTSLDPRVNLGIANSIWYRNTFPVEQAFISTNQQYFNSEVTPLDFSNAESVNTINNWVSDKTNQLIPSIVDQISPETVMYLINAVYYKGQWRYQFDKSATSSQPFYQEDGSAHNCLTMAQHTTLSYFSGEYFSAIELPYNQGNFNMVVMLPNAGRKVADIVPSLTKENWDAWYKLFSPLDMQLTLPRFSFDYEEKAMKSIMAEMGMPDAFEPELADFSRINQDYDLYISEVKHKTHIETNEEGTEAAAVTSIGISVTSVPVVKEVNVNRPFIFFIHEKSTGAILFIGTVMNPAVSGS